MFKTVLQEHNAKRAETRRRSDKAKAAADASGEKLASALVDAVDSQVSRAFQQEKDLSREAKEARNLASKFRDQTANWISAAQRADKVLRDYGDYETYLQTIVNDMTEVLENCLGKLAPVGGDLPQLIVEAVRKKAGVVRALRTKWALLARDLLALATGIRAAVMLDYAAVQPQVLLDLVARVAELRHEAGQHMVVGTWDSCCYILRKDLLGRRACHREEALWLKLAGDGTEKHMQMASPQDQEAVHQQVDGLLRILHSVNPAHDICDLALSKGDFIMPTLNGWLLGYPVIYLVDEVNVQATADHLSAEGVQRHIVMASSPVLKAACQKYGLSNAAALEELEVLLSFTVPLSAADGVRAHAQSQWVSGLHSSVECQTSEGVWGGIHVVCEETTQRMQL